MTLVSSSNNIGPDTELIIIIIIIIIIITIIYLTANGLSSVGGG